MMNHGHHAAVAEESGDEDDEGPSDDDAGELLRRRRRRLRCCSRSRWGAEADGPAAADAGESIATVVGHDAGPDGGYG